MRAKDQARLTATRIVVQYSALLSATPTDPFNANQARAIGLIDPKSGFDSEAEIDLSSSLLVPGRSVACQCTCLLGNPLDCCAKKDEFARRSDAVRIARGQSE